MMIRLARAQEWPVPAPGALILPEQGTVCRPYDGRTRHFGNSARLSSRNPHPVGTGRTYPADPARRADVAAYTETRSRCPDAVCTS